MAVGFGSAPNSWLLLWLRWLRRDPALEMLSEGATVSVSLKSSTIRSSMKSSESSESEAKSFLLACDLVSRPSMLPTRDAALEATFEDAGGGDGARLLLLLRAFE